MSKIFTEKDMQSRYQRLRLAMQAEDIDAMVVLSYHGSCYLSGVPMVQYGRYAASILPSDPDKAPAVVVPTMEKERFKELSNVEMVYDYDDDDYASNHISKIASRILKDKYKITRGKVGFEGKALPFQMLEIFRRKLGDVNPTDISDIMEKTMMTKTSEEIDMLRKANTMADVGIRAILDKGKVGLTEAEIIAIGSRAVNEALLENYPQAEFSANVFGQSGPRTLIPHGGATGRAIQRGEFIECVIEVYLWAYQGVVERPIIAGSPSPELRSLLNLSTRAHNEEITAAKPAVKLSEVNNTGAKVFVDAGFGKLVRSGSGLSRGIINPYAGRIDISDLRPYIDTKCEENMVLSIEPSCHHPTLGAPRYCTSVRVTEKSNEPLNQSPCGILNF